MKHIAIILTFLFPFFSSVRAQADIAEGKSIFRNRCASCHAIDKQVIGPALKDVNNRHDEKWIIDFVHSSQTVIKSGNEAAVKLFEGNNQTIMPDHQDLSEVQIKNILAYIKSESVGKPAAAFKEAAPEYTKPYNNKNSIINKIVYLNFDSVQKPLQFSDTASWLVIATLIVLLIIFFYVITYLYYILDVFSNKKTRSNGRLEDANNGENINDGIEKEHA